MHIRNIKMRKKTFSLTVLFLFSICSIMECYAQTDADKGDFQISGRISGRDTGSVMLWYRNSVNEMIRDTTTLDHGRFTFSGSVRGACEALILTNLQFRHFDDESIIRIILQPGLTDISKTDGVKQATITGSHAQAEKDKWDSIEASLTAAEDRCFETADSLKKHKQPNGQEYNDQIELLYKQTDSLRIVRFRLDVGYVAQHPESYLGGYLLAKQVRRLSVDSVMLLYTALADSVKNSSIGHEVLKYIYPLTNDTAFRNKNPLIDDAFTKRLASIRSIHDFSLRDRSGKLINFTSFKGKYLLIKMWTSWCGPCIKNIPVWNTLLKQYDPKVIQFISVSLDTDVDSWNKALGKYKPDGIQLIDTNEFKGLFAIYCKVLWVGKFLLVDPAGRIVNYDADQDGETAWRRLIDSFIKKRTIKLNDKEAPREQ